MFNIKKIFVFLSLFCCILLSGCYGVFLDNKSTAGKFKTDTSEKYLYFTSKSSYVLILVPDTHKISSSYQINLWDFSKRKQILRNTISAQNIIQLELSEDKRFLAYNTADSGVWLYDIKNKTTIQISEKISRNLKWVNSKLYFIEKVFNSKSSPKNTSLYFKYFCPQKNKSFIISKASCKKIHFISTISNDYKIFLYKNKDNTFTIYKTKTLKKIATLKPFNNTNSKSRITATLNNNYVYFCNSNYNKNNNQSSCKIYDLREHHYLKNKIDFLNYTECDIIKFISDRFILVSVYKHHTHKANYYLVDLKLHKKVLLPWGLKSKGFIGDINYAELFNDSENILFITTGSDSSLGVHDFNIQAYIWNTSSDTYTKYFTYGIKNTDIKFCFYSQKLNLLVINKMFKFCPAYLKFITPTIE